MKFLRITLAAAGIGIGVYAEPGDAAEALRLAAEGARAAAAGENEAYLENLEAAVELRPDFPQLLMNLAAAQVANDRLDEAIATLERAGALGVGGNITRSDEYAPLRGRKEFEAVARKFATNSHPQGRGDVAFTLRGVTGQLEGISWRQSSGEFFFADAHARAIWQRNKDNTLRRFTAEDDTLLGVFGIAIDEENGAIWAATAAVPAMRGYSSEQEGVTALAEIDLASGEVRRTLAPPNGDADSRSHQFRDVAVRGDGTVFVTDSLGAAVWALRPGAAELESIASGPDLLAPQGIAISRGDAVLVADRLNGLLRVDAGGEIRRLEPPAEATLVGIDGIAVAPNDAVLAIQTSTSPKRVLRIALDGAGEEIAGVAVLEAGHLTMAAPARGCIGPDGDFYFIGNTGAGRLEGGTATAPRPVPVFKTKVGGGR